MKIYKNLCICVITLIFNVIYAYGDDIQVADFNELINSNPQSGDVIEFTDNLNSDASIGNRFLNLNLTFDGNNYYLNGNNDFSGFILNQDSIFNNVDFNNCKGQEYQGSDFAGALFNFNGNMRINSSNFSGNFVNAGDTDYGIGGAVYNLNTGLINIDSANFNGNYAHGALAAGGAGDRRRGLHRAERAGEQHDEDRTVESRGAFPRAVGVSLLTGREAGGKF